MEFREEHARGPYPKPRKKNLIPVFIVTYLLVFLLGFMGGFWFNAGRHIMMVIEANTKQREAQAIKYENWLKRLDRENSKLIAELNNKQAEIDHYKSIVSSLSIQDKTEE